MLCSCEFVPIDIRLSLIQYARDTRILADINDKPYLSLT